MPENIQRTSGRPGAYKLDRGGAIAESGPFIGEVVNNTDPTRAGRVQVWIEDLSGPDKTDKSLWRTVSYISPFFGTTPQSGTSKGSGTYVGNKQSYGMWATAPDVGTSVICFFASGDPNQGYYLGSVVQPGANHMVPAIGATKDFKNDNKAQDAYFKGATQLPTGEINVEDTAIDQNPRYFDQKKPVHGVTAGVMLQQGTITDPVRGPTSSNAQRETPSAVMGISSPGRPVYEGGYDNKTYQKKLEKNEVTPEQGKMISRQGGHSIVLDDGEMDGSTQQMRFRTAKGHQITMSDDGDTLFITHANGQTTFEMGKEGTVDIYSTNSVNLRSQGDINLHADRNVNIQGQQGVNICGTKSVAIDTQTFSVLAKQNASISSAQKVTLKGDGSIMLDSGMGSWKGGSQIILSAAKVSTNGPAAPAVSTAAPIATAPVTDVKFTSGSGFQKDSSENTTSIASRVPTHQPQPQADKGVAVSTSLNKPVPAEPSPAVAATLNKVNALPAALPAINTGDFAKMAGAAQTAIGSLNTQSIQGMMAQVAKNVGQASDQISNTLGVGQFGFNAQQLEAAGLLKPGTFAAYLSSGQNTLEQVLKSPSVWTGKEGANSLTSFLSDVNIQNVTQNTLFQQSFDNLKANGLIQGTETANVLGPLINTTSQFGLGSVQQWLKQGSGIVGQATSVASGLSSGSIAGITGAVGGAAALASGATTAATSAFNALSKADLSVDSITSGADKLLTQGVDQITNLGTQYADQAKTLVTGAVAQANQVVSGVVGQAEALQKQIAALPDAAVTAMDNAAKAGLQAVDTVQKKFSSLVKGFSAMSEGAELTTNRAAVDAAVKEVIGNEKVPSPTYTLDFSFGGLADLGNKAIAAVNDLQKTATDTLAQVKGAIPKLPNIG